MVANLSLPLKNESLYFTTPRTFDTGTSAKPKLSTLSAPAMTLPAWAGVMSSFRPANTLGMKPSALVPRMAFQSGGLESGAALAAAVVAAVAAPALAAGATPCFSASSWVEMTAKRMQSMAFPQSEIDEQSDTALASLAALAASSLAMASMLEAQLS